MSEQIEQKGGIWLPHPDDWVGMFGLGATPEKAFLAVVQKSTRASLGEINELAKQMGLKLTLRVERMPAPKPEGEANDA